MATPICVSDYDQLRKVPPPNPPPGLHGQPCDYIFVAGLPSPHNSGLQGFFAWHADSTKDDDGGTVIKPNVPHAMGRWHRVFDGAISVKWFGAKGDYNFDTHIGTDDTAAFKNALATGAARIEVPDSTGAYKITSTLFPATPVDIVGLRSLDGPVLYGDVDDYVIETTASSKTVRLDHLTLRGNPARPNNGGVRLFDNTDRAIEHCTFRDFTKEAIHIVQTVNAPVQNCRIYSCGTGIRHDKGSTAVVSCSIEDTYIGECTIGIDLDTSTGFEGWNVIVENCTTGLKAVNSNGFLLDTSRATRPILIIRTA
jgi:Right handed beta helix region